MLQWSLKCAAHLLSLRSQGTGRVSVPPVEADASPKWLMYSLVMHVL